MVDPRIAGTDQVFDGQPYIRYENWQKTFDRDKTYLGRIVADQVHVNPGDNTRTLVPYITSFTEPNFVPEGAPIPVAEGRYSHVQVFNEKLGVLYPMSIEVIQTSPEAKNAVLDQMCRRTIAAANKALLAKEPKTGSPLTGLMRTQGIVQAGAVGADNLDKVAEVIALTEEAAGRCRALIMDPASWSYLRTIKQSKANAVPLISADVTGETKPKLFGVPVTTSTAVPRGNILGIGEDSVVAAAGSPELAMSMEAGFNAYSVHLRATWHIGWAVVNPKGIVRATVGVSNPVDIQPASTSS